MAFDDVLSGSHPDADVDAPRGMEELGRGNNQSHEVTVARPSLDDINALVASGESETVEFKKSTGQRSDAARSVCAMLNTRGGVVLFGVNPNASLVGQDVSERTLEQLSAAFSEIDPPVFPTIDRVRVGSRFVIRAEVPKGNQRPYRYRGRALRRVGNTNRELSSAEAERMLIERLHGDRRWETEPATNWSIADLDEEEIARTLEASIKSGRGGAGLESPREVLRGVGLIRDDVLLRAACVLFGRRERLISEFPQCFLRVARFAGTDKTEFRDNRQFRGHAFALLADAERFLHEHVPIASRIAPGLFERQDTPLYPPIALREALANAFCHRDYSIGGGSVGVGVYDDRLEITSSGGLHFGLTPEALFEPHESLPWNPLIAGVFYRRGIIESWGRGTQQMAELAVAAGLPRPEIEDTGGRLTVRFRPTGYVPPERVGHDLTERQRAILALLHGARRGLALREILSLLTSEASSRQVREDLRTLRTLNLAAPEGHGRGARWNPL